MMNSSQAVLIRPAVFPVYLYLEEFSHLQENGLSIFMGFFVFNASLLNMFKQIRSDLIMNVPCDSYVIINQLVVGLVIHSVSCSIDQSFNHVNLLVSHLSQSWQTYVRHASHVSHMSSCQSVNKSYVSQSAMSVPVMSISQSCQSVSLSQSC